MLTACILALAVAAPQVDRVDRVDPAAPVAPITPVVVRVDPRLELFSIVFRLAGNPEFNQPASKSPYAQEVAKHFGPFKDHAVIARARELRAKNGVSFDAVASFAMHVRDAQTLTLDGPEGDWLTRLDPRWTPESREPFLELLRDFKDKTGFAGFFAAHHDLYASVESRMSDLLARKLDVLWFAKFFGAQSDAVFTVHPGLLLGGCNFGVGVKLLNSPEEITPCIGCWTFDDEGVPTFPDDVLPTIVHEFCHTYANRIVDAHFELLEPPGAKLFPAVREIMSQQAYPTWKIVLYESLVRASVLRYLESHEPAAIPSELAQLKRAGFAWVEGLAGRLAEYESDRERYPQLGAFAPRIADFFANYTPVVKAPDPNAPRILKLVPENGAKDVSPTVQEIVIEFDRAMNGNLAVMLVDSQGAFPTIDKKRRTAFDGARRVLRIAVILEPDRDYAFGLNTGGNQKMASADGTVLEPIVVRFRTASK